MLDAVNLYIMIIYDIVVNSPKGVFNYNANNSVSINHKGINTAK